MDTEALDLLSALQAAQAQTSKSRLSERTVVELVVKLKSLGYLGDELLHTINGKEYITTDRLKADIQVALLQAGGRLALVDLPALVGVDLVHCEVQADTLVKESAGKITSAQGELMTTRYFDAICGEMNGLLQEAGKLSLADMAIQYALNTELLLSIVSSRVGSIITATLAGSILFTNAYLRNIKAQLRGALSAIAQPCSIPDLVKSLNLEGLQQHLISNLLEELVAEGALKGSLKGGGMSWTPAVYAKAQQQAVTAFYNQNGWIGYDTGRKMGLGNSKAYLSNLFPDGIPLETVFAAPSLLTPLDAAVEEAVSSGGWVDVQGVLPTTLTSADITLLLNKSPAVKLATEAKNKTTTPKASILAGTCIVSTACIEEAKKKLEEAAEKLAESALQKRKSSGQGVSTSAPGSGAAGAGKGKAAVGDDEDDEDDDWSLGPKKGKKGKGGKPKGGKSKVGAVSGGSKAKSETANTQSGADVGLTVDSVTEQLEGWLPDMVGVGSDEGVLAAMSEQLLPAAMAAYQKRLQSVLTAGAEDKRKKKDLVVKNLEGIWHNLGAYAGGVKILEDDEGTQTLVQKHVVKTTGSEAAEQLLHWIHLEFLAELQPQEEGAPLPSLPATPAERSKLTKQLQPDVSAPFGALLDTLTGSSVEELESAVETAAGACGIRLRKMDKKQQKAWLSNQQARLQEAIQNEESPSAVLALTVPFLVAKHLNAAILLPGRAIAGVLQRLEPVLEEEAFQEVTKFHELVVEQLKLQSSGDGARSAALLQQLQDMLPGVKALSA